MTTQLIALIAETAIHAGAGTSNGYIDLPIQREAHTDWPCIFGSSVKGALRAAATVLAPADSAERKQVNWLFGPETGAPDTEAGAGALIVTDARLLLFPVRSLTSHYRWVTCSALLKRLRSDMARLELDFALDLPASGPEVDKALVPAAVPGGALYLDELNFAADHSINLDPLCRSLHRITGLPLADIEARLAIIHDDRFAYLSRYATPVNTHVALDNKKTVKPGQLWTEESLPPDTVLYVGTHLARRAGLGDGAGISLLKRLSYPTDYLQIGGNETVGMGFVRIHTAGAAA